MNIRISCMENLSLDESIMSVVRAAALKAILKSLFQVTIHPPITVGNMSLITQTNGTLPVSVETKAIHRYIHKGVMTKKSFFGVLKVE